MKLELRNPLQKEKKIHIGILLDYLPVQNSAISAL